MITQIIKNVPNEIQARIDEVRSMTRHEKLHLLAFLIIGFVFVFGLLDYACR